MDLVIVSERGPDILTNIDGLKPLGQDGDIVVFGSRDAEQSASYGSQDAIYELLDCSIWPSISQDLMKQPLSVNFCTLLGNPVKLPTFTLLSESLVSLEKRRKKIVYYLLFQKNNVFVAQELY